MKYLILLIISIVFIACNTNNDINKQKIQKKIQKEEMKIVKPAVEWGGLELK